MSKMKPNSASQLLYHSTVMGILADTTQNPQRYDIYEKSP